MSELFLKLLNMSISASWLILAVLLVRFVLKKAPKWISLLLWGLVAVRLVFPFSIESAWSLIPSAEPVSPEMVQSAAPALQTGIPVIGSPVEPMIGESLAPAPEAGANPLQIWLLLLAAVWAIGIVGFAVYTVIVCRRLRRRVSTAVLLRDNVFQSENVGSPFVLGVLRPRIYLPFRISPRDAEHVIAHEQAHIARRDHWWKPLGFLLLAIYWFNPLVWLSYILLCRDIELACDEKVIKKLGNEQRAAYTEALLACSVNRRMIAVCPLAFGEVGVKERVKSVRNYKKPAFWIIILAVIACVVVAVCFLTNPASKKEPNEGNPDAGTGNSEALSDNSEGTSDMEYNHSDMEEIAWPINLLPKGFPAAEYDKIYSAERRDNEVIIILFGENSHTKKTNSKMFALKLVQSGYLPYDDIDTRERFYISRDGYKVTLADSDSDNGYHLASVNEESPTGYTFEIKVRPFDTTPYECMFWKYPDANTDLGLESKVFDKWPTEYLPEGFEKPDETIEILGMEQKSNGLFITLRGTVPSLGDYEIKAQKNAGYVYSVGNIGMTSSGDYFYREQLNFERSDGKYISTVRYQFCPANDRIKK